MNTIRNWIIRLLGGTPRELELRRRDMLMAYVHTYVTYVKICAPITHEEANWDDLITHINNIDNDIK